MGRLMGLLVVSCAWDPLGPAAAEPTRLQGTEAHAAAGVHAVRQRTYGLGAQARREGGLGRRQRKGPSGPCPNHPRCAHVLPLRCESHG